MTVFWAVIITLAVLLIRAFARPNPPQGPATPTPMQGPAAPTPTQILADRFARGEIDEEEYRRRLATLRGSDDDPHNPGDGRTGLPRSQPQARHL
ncbi:SHOCT domain-containing protein [Actinacidiphila glaucinigra]|uniref:SHOCT domain-containing protein n=1 Tax=Actinacidiphila glaucinigra TaxID=235986 RepID=UPI00378EFA08